MNESSEKKCQILVSDFRAALEKNIHDVQYGGVSLQFKDYLQEPEKEELPRLFEIGVDAFYRGEYVDEREYQPLPGFTTRRNIRHKMVGRMLITKEEIFKSLSPESLTLRSAHKTKSEEFLHVMIVGPAGSGKTTILKRYARDACHGNVPQIQHKKVFIHWISCRSFSKDDKITTEEFLFQYMNLRPSDEAIKHGYDEMLKNSEDVIFILDSLDTLTYELDEEFEIIGPYDIASPATILYNIFLGIIFPKARILSSSREYKIRNYQGELRADRIISLGGLTHGSIHNLVYGFLVTEEADRVWKILHTQCLDLMLLCETPVFLAFTLVGLVEKGTDDSFVPNTMSGVMVNLLQSLLRSKHARSLARFSQEYVIAAINKMKRLSFEGTLKKKVLFRSDDLTNVELTTEEITDLAIVVPGKTQEPYYQQILEGDAIAIFAHQVLQEVLTALSVTEMSEKIFMDFIRNFIHEPYFSVIRRLTCGLLLDERVFEKASENLLEVTGEAEHLQRILTTSMAGQFNQFSELGMVDRLELFRAIHEAGIGATNIVPAVIEKIVLMNTTLITSDMYALASSIFYCECLKKLSIVNCKLSSDALRGFANRLVNSSLKVTEIEIVGESDMGSEGLETVGNIVRERRVENLKIVLCELSSQTIAALLYGLGNSSFKLLDLSDNHHMGVIGLKTIGSITDRCFLHSLILTGCKLTPDLLLALQRGLGNAQLDLLNVSRNKDMSEEGMKTLGEIIVKHEVKKFGISGCRLKVGEGIILRNSIGEYKLNELLVTRRSEYFGYYDHHDDPQCTAIGEILPVVRNSVDMTGHDLKNVDQLTLLDKLDQLYPEAPTLIYGDEDDPTTLLPKHRQSQLDHQNEHGLVVSSKSLQVTIGPKGKEVKIGSCSLIFHGGTFDTDTQILVILEINSSKWPRGYLCITPMLIVEAKNLLKPVTVRIGSWCKNDGSKKGKSSSVDVLHLADGEFEWNVITRLPFNDDLVFQFECRNFSPVIIGRPDESLGSECFVIESYIFANTQNNFSLAFCLSDDLVINKLIKTMERRESKMKINFSPISVKETDKIKTTVICQHPNGFSFHCGDQIVDYGCFEFKIDTDFMRLKKMKMFNFFMSSPQNMSSRLHLKCDIYKNDVIEEENQCFQYDWQHEGSANISQILQQALVLSNATKSPSSDASNAAIQQISKFLTQATSGAQHGGGGEGSSTVSFRPVVFNIANTHNVTASNVAYDGGCIEDNSTGGLCVVAGKPENTTLALEAASSAICDSNLSQLTIDSSTSSEKPCNTIEQHDVITEAEEETKVLMEFPEPKDDEIGSSNQ